MKIVMNMLLIYGILFFSGLNAVQVTESRLKVKAGKILYTLVKTEWETTAKMSGVGEKFSGTVDVEGKKVDITASVKRDSFYLTGEYKFANDLMHEGYLESEVFPTANFQGEIISYDTSSGDIKVKGKMTIHGVSKENVEIAGKLKKDKNGYLFTSNFKVNPKEFKMDPPKIKEVDIAFKLELTAQ